MAEKEGCLAEVMPRFAKRINFVTDIKLKIASALSFPIMELVIILIISSSLSIFIVPKFNKIFLELLGDEPTPVFLSRYSFASNWIFSHFLEIVLSFFLFLIVFRHLKPYLKIAYEEIIIRIPFLNKGVKWNALLELAGSMASYLASGKDMSEAAELSAKSAEFPWIRKKLSKFAQSVRNGDDWTQAWREMKLGSSINDWIVMNSVGRNNPAEGFDTMLIWLSNDISKASVRKIRWIEISGILFIGLFVAVTAIALMGSIFKIIGFLAETL